MSCIKTVFGIPWENHRWRRRVTGTEVITAHETDMWARPVYRDYIRCDKEDVCERCGAVRREVSCLCEPAEAERCAIRREWIAQSGPAAP